MKYCTQYLRIEISFHAHSKHLQTTPNTSPLKTNQNPQPFQWAKIDHIIFFIHNKNQTVKQS